MAITLVDDVLEQTLVEMGQAQTLPSGNKTLIARSVLTAFVDAFERCPTDERHQFMARFSALIDDLYPARRKGHRSNAGGKNARRLRSVSPRPSPSAGAAANSTVTDSRSPKRKRSGAVSSPVSDRAALSPPPSARNQGARAASTSPQRRAV